MQSSLLLPRLGPRPVTAPARARCPRLTRTLHAAYRGRRVVLRVAAEARPGTGTGTEADLRSLLMRLREDDVEYFDLKTLCKDWQLGGRDSKENLRAKLLRRVRQELGLPIFGPDNVPPSTMRLPQAMSQQELLQLFETRGCMMPANQAQALIMANALLVADGLLDPDQVVWPEAVGPWSSMTVVQLKAACTSRGLPTKGLREDLISRLEEQDVALAAGAVAAAAAEAAEAAPPSTANNAQLQAAQDLFASMHHMEVAQLREEVQRRGLKTQGTKQVLLAKLSEALEREVAAALGGEQRLAQWAANAVGRLGEQEVVAELSVRGVRADQYPTPEAAAAALQAVMHRDWVAEALHGGQQQAQAGPDEDGEWAAGGVDGDAYGEGGEGGDGAGMGGGGGGDLYGGPYGGVEAARAWVWGRAGDPTLALSLLVGGHTHVQRDAALAAARLAAQLLQSDRSHGLLPRQQLELGAGGEREGIAVSVHYATAGTLFPLTWEQLHSCSATELDTRLALQPDSATSAADLAASADVVLPLGLPPSSASLMAAAAGKVAGSVADEAVAALAADRLAFAGAAAQLGFPAAPALRLQLADFADAAEAEALADMAVYARLEAFAAEHLAPDALPRLAVRIEFGGSVLGGCLATGARDALVASLVLMQEHGVSEVVVEAVQPGAHHFTCSVLATDQGAVALPPTELSYWDVEDDIAECELRMERWLAAREGLDPEGVEALLELLRQEQRSHPGYLGGVGSPSQQLRQSTPPAALSAEATQAVRQASAKLFQGLGLRDYAQFSGWVLPPRQPELEQALNEAAALEAEQQKQQQQQQQQQDAEEQQQEQEEQQKTRGRSFAELQAIDEAVRAEAEAARAASGFGGADDRATDRAGAADTSAASGFLGADLAVAQGEAAAAADYGVFSGIVIDDSYRPTCDQILELGPFGRPIPTEQPQPVVEALEDLSAASPQQLCQLGSGHSVAFATISLAPDLGTPTSVLCQQAAAVGLSHEALLRHLVSAASVRAGGLPLPPLPEVAAAKEQQAAEGEADAAEAARDAAAGEAGEGQEGAEAGRDWGLLGRLAVLDEAAVQQYIDSEFMFSNWLPPEEATAAAAEQATEDGAAEAEGADAAAAGGEEAGAAGAFEFIDATDEPLLDPVAQLEAEPSVGAPYSPGYDEIREGAAHMGVGDPLADWTASAAAQQQQDGGLEHMHPTKQRVWVLLGGDGARRTQSLQAGLHAYLSLRNDPELLVEAFMLEPSAAGTSEMERRRVLLDRRLELQQLGLEDEEILQEYEHLDLSRIRHPSPARFALENHGVWRLSDSGLVRGEVEDLQVGCEEALATANSSLATLEDRGGDIAGAQLSVARQELALLGVSLDGSAWGGASADKLDPAQYMWLRDFAAQAQEVGAVVLLALAGQPAAHGPLQRLLEEAGVPYTGSGHLAAETCADKAMLIEQLIDLSTSGISTAPQQKISLPELSAQCVDEATADRLFEQLRSSLGAGPVSLCIKPAHACNGLGVMRATGGRDLMAYAQAVEAWVDVMPGEVLGGSPDVVMPVPPPSQFVVEPWIVTEPVRVLRSADGGIVPPEGQAYPDAAPEDGLAQALHWPAASSNEWLAVSAVLLGEAGRMRCLGPSVRVLQLREAVAGPGSAADVLQRVQQLALVEEAAEAEDEDEADALMAAAAELGTGHDEAEPLRLLTGAFDLTPPPPTLALPTAVASARLRLEMVADRLGLSGAAEVAGYMQVETGEVVVSDVSTTPDLSPGALIFRQAAAADAPLSPAEVLQELIRVGLTQPLDERDDLQALGYPELGEEAADYDYPRDASYSAYSGALSDVPEGSSGQYGAAQQW